MGTEGGYENKPKAPLAATPPRKVEPPAPKPSQVPAPVDAVTKTAKDEEASSQGAEPSDAGTSSTSPSLTAHDELPGASTSEPVVADGAAGSPSAPLNNEPASANKVDDHPLQVTPRSGAEALHAVAARAGHQVSRERSHSASRPDKVQVDESELDWRAYVKPKDPGAVLGALDLVPGLQPEAPNTNQERIGPGIRQMAWHRYQLKADEVAATRERVADDYANFMTGAKSPDLIALGFTVPYGFRGDAAAFADAQNVSGATSLGSLFSRRGSTNLGAEDHRGIANARGARERSGAAKPEHDATVVADHRLRSKLLAFQSAEEGVRGAFSGIESARLGIERVRLTREVYEDREALEAAKGHAEDVKNTVEFVFGGALKAFVADPEEAVDLMESVGTIASYAVGKMSGNAIARAEAALKAATFKLHDTAAKEAASKFEEAKLAMRSKILAMKAAREAVLAELGQRKAAYEVAGTASAQASGGSRLTQAKISALVAALPVVEAMTGLIKGMVARTAHQPTYDTTAGVGFHMAAHAGRPQATNFMTALGEMAFIHSRFQMLDVEWSRRLLSLQHTQAQLGGVRPEADEDLVKSVLGGAPAQSPDAGGGE
ncbi:MAG: hypothetical protein IPQ07_11175 [Myxococcales bacterium]|nr:hypothetical protein [Myxococcales bacterium]